MAANVIIVGFILASLFLLPVPPGFVSLAKQAWIHRLNLHQPVSHIFFSGFFI